MKRRQFIKTTAVGTAATYLGSSLIFGMPSAFSADLKSRVVRASHSNVIDSNETINPKIVRTVVDETVIALTNQTSIRDAWIQIFPTCNLLM